MVAKGDEFGATKRKNVLEPCSHSRKATSVGGTASKREKVMDFTELGDSFGRASPYEWDAKA